MAVLVRKRLDSGNEPIEVETYLPPGGLTRSDRIAADRLDETLSRQVPLMAERIEAEVGDSESLLRRWYLLGEALHQIADDEALVSPIDRDDGLIWLAIWWYLPESLMPAGSSAGDPFMSGRHKRKDHLSLCYEFARLPWSSVSWIRRWDDWQQMAFRPSILRDRRIVDALATSLADLPAYPTRLQFRAIVKRLGLAFPTRSMRDTSVYGDARIQSTVASALAQALVEDSAHG